MELLKQNQKEQIIIITKSDLTQKLQTKKLDSYNPIYLNTKENISPLIDKLEEILNKTISTNSMMLISKQQINEVTQTLNQINQSFKPLEIGELEFFAYHINEALEYLSNITRPYEHKEMLDVMFSEFCLGK